MSYSFSFISHFIGALGFFLLTLLASVGWHKAISGRALILASFVTSLWSLSIATQDYWGTPSFSIRYSLEILRDFSWSFLLLRIIGFDTATLIKPRKSPLLVLSICLGLFTLIPLIAHWSSLFFSPNFLSSAFTGDKLIISNIIFSILGLALIEQVLRNTKQQNQWQIKFLCIGLAIIIAYDFFLYSNALLFDSIDSSLWAARGFVNISAIPFLIIASTRNSARPMRFNLSREFVFHSTVISFSGLYLVCMAAAGYYIRIFGGSWGSMLQIMFILLGSLFLITLIFSGSIRAKLRVLLSRHLFSYKYDYRQEWLSITKILTDNQQHTPFHERTVYALGKIINSRGGALWLADSDGNFTFHHASGCAKPPVTVLTRNEALIRFLIKRNWIIDLNELNQDPELYNNLRLPEWLLQQKEAWLIIPLMLHDRLFGFVILNKSVTVKTLNWEDHDIIKVAGRQAASALAQLEASTALAQAQQFEAFNQMSAFIVHDIKTLITQLSLMVKNAEKHKTNPDFIDDMIQTTDHSVNKMTRLLKQLSDNNSNQTMTDENKNTSTILLNKLLTDLVQKFKKNQPQPFLSSCNDEVFVHADYDKLFNVIGHLIQNAQEACYESGTIDVYLNKHNNCAEVKITDSGCGMTQHFMKNDLFRPFRSSKGVSGMGIGAYQCQQYILSINGTLHVSSQKGHGSEFIIKIPSEVPDIAQQEVSG